MCTSCSSSSPRTNQEDRPNSEAIKPSDRPLSYSCATQSAKATRFSPVTGPLSGSLTESNMPRMVCRRTTTRHSRRHKLPFLWEASSGFDKATQTRNSHTSTLPHPRCSQYGRGSFLIQISDANSLRLTTKRYVIGSTPEGH